ncbi:MAG: efflux RND transporter periplasmic adaptor subunit [Thermoflexales bacterium]|nr:efflux RND transporter periplasmic adaptor subunit [Thermoflexales bacterium]
MKRALIIASLIVVAAAAGGGYLAYTRYTAKPVVAQESIVRTGTVSRGDIVITADGTGNVLPGDERAVGFQVSGVLVEVKVKVGDVVHKGDVLAKVDTLDLDNSIREATYELEQARLNLDQIKRDVEAGTDVELAKKNLEIARLGLANAQGSYASTLLSADVSADVREAKAYADFWQSDLGDKWLRLDENPNSEQRKLEYERAGAQAEKATNNWKKIEQDAQNKKTSAWRSVVSAQQSYLSAQASYSETLENDPLRAAELSVFQKEVALTKAQVQLSYATLTAPIDGTITEVNGKAGENVGSGTFATLIDLDTPMVRFWVEEADLDKVIVGNTINATFEALPDETITGTITSVEPVLVTVGSTSAVQAWAALHNNSKSTLLSGMTAEVEVIAAETRNALLVPVEALREITTGQYAVFVSKDDGSMELRTVTVGLQDLVNAEILSGLQEGETVTLATADSSQQAQSNSNLQMGGEMPGGGGFIMGGGMGGLPGGMP